MKQKISLFICALCAFASYAREPITIHLSMPYGSTDVPYIYAWDNNNEDITSGYPGDEMILEGEVYSYTFDKNISSVNIYFCYSDSYYTEDFMGITSSCCFKLDGMIENGYVNCSKINCQEELNPIILDTVTIRLDPSTVDWKDAYLYVWSGEEEYSGNYNVKKVGGEKMTITDDGWFTYSFVQETGSLFYMGFAEYSAKSPEYYDNIKYSQSTCFEVDEYYELIPVDYRDLSPNGTNSITVHVVTPGTLGQLIVQKMGTMGWTDILALTVSGSINSADQQYFSRLTQLRYLDLKGTDITTIGGCQELKDLSKVTLPPTCETILENAFSDCSRLDSINLNDVLYVDNHAFYNCSWLEEAYMPKVLYIGNNAFENCESIAAVNISSAISIGNGAFYNNSYLSHVILSDKLVEIPDYCFYGCASLTSIVLPNSIKTIGKYAFQSVKEIQLPTGLTRVDYGNFRNATSIEIPSTVWEWNSYSSSWKNIYCHIVAPLDFSAFDNDDVTSATLHVPSISLSAYKLHDIWYRFGKIVPMDNLVDNLVISDDFTLLTTDGISNDANLTINFDGALTLSAETPLSVENYLQRISCYQREYDYDYDNNCYYSYLPYFSALLANSVVKANNVMVRLLPKINQWNFFSLPFDVNMADITLNTEGDVQWVIREYSGANRASGNGDTWNNVPANGVLKAHKGYILFCVCTFDDEGTCVFNMPAAHNDNLQQIFATSDVNVPLIEYSAEFPQNRSWNLVGNPYPCLFDIQQMDFEAPITTWNGNGYTAYSPLDDNYMLRPAEGFFVQAPQGVNQITFHKEGRSAVNKQEVTQEEYNNGRYYAPRRVKANNITRKVFNFTLSNADYSDRARLVLNEDASADYELTRDAAKMLSSDKTVPQLFFTDNGIRYAINERPEKDHYTMGTYLGRTGEYSIHVQSEVPDSVWVIDLLTGVVTDITRSAYTFTTEAGTFNNRFIVTFGAKAPTGMEEIEEQQLSNRKMLMDGQLFIIKNGVKYTIQGQIIK